MKQASPFANERTGLFGYVFSGGLFVQFERDQQSFVVAGPVSSCGGDEFVLAVVFHPLATDDRSGRPYDLGFLDAEPLSGIVINEIDPVAFVGIAGPYQRAYVDVFVISRLRSRIRATSVFGPVAILLQSPLLPPSLYPRG